MDNDSKLIKKIKQTIKSCKFKYDYRDLKVLSDDDGNRKIREYLGSDEPFAVVRGGATEMRCIEEYLSKGVFSEKIKQEISTLSGVFSNDTEALKRFCDLYISSMSNADLISLWGVGAESTVVHKYCRNSEFTELHSLEPYYFSKPWSSALKGKKVLIVHPFKESIEKQYGRRAELFPGTDILPEFESIQCIRAVQTIAGEKSEYKTWFDALKYMKSEIANADFDTAIIGAGAYGLPLTVYCKEIGKQAIQMSGATQILFGIKGKRWDEHPVISKLYNDAWVRPSEAEIPKQQKKVEGGSYW